MPNLHPQSTIMLLPQTQRLLKANAAREIGMRVVFNFEDLHHQGNTYLAQVRQQAEAMLQAALQEADVVRETARREAKEEGRQEGLKDSAGIIEEQSTRLAEQRLKERLDATLPAVAAVAAAMRQELDQWLIRWEKVAVRIAVAIAQKIIHRQLETQPDIAAGMIKEALRLAAGHPQLRIHLCPQDVTYLGPHAADIVRSVTACAEAVVIPDPEITRGGCRIETRHGEIDARLETMLDRIVEELLA
jgi:flagellar assembly protein FliH